MLLLMHAMRQMNLRLIRECVPLLCTHYSGLIHTTRQLPGIPPEIGKMFENLMTPLKNAAGQLQLGRRLLALPGKLIGGLFNLTLAE